VTLTVHATQPPACPSWCREDHTGPDLTHWGEAHAVPSADPTLTVGAALRQDPDGQPVIALDVAHDTVTPDGAIAYAMLLLELADQDRPTLGATMRLSDSVNVGATFRSGPVVGHGTVSPEHFPVPVDMPAYPVVLVAGPDGSVVAWSADRLDTSERTS
jgi:hypothetical protein